MLFVIGSLGIAGVQAFGQEEKIYEQEPFDIIVLDRANQNQELRTLPLNLPGRRIPANPSPNAVLRVRLLNNPDEELEVAWRGIARIELFEQRVLARAQELVKAGRFDEAFEHLTFLQDNYPKVDGLDGTLNQLLYAEASTLYRDKQHERALLLLDEIYQRQADPEKVAVALTRVLQDLLTNRFDVGDYRDARRIYRVAQDRYGKSLADFLSTWRRRFEEAAQEKTRTARSLLAEGREREAFLMARQVTEIWPDADEALKLLTETSQRYPLLRVGVTQQYAPQPDPTAYNWAARRVERLLMRQLFELEDIGPDGGIYQTVVGTSEVAPDGRMLSLQVAPAPSDTDLFSGLDVARLLLVRADPQRSTFDPHWAALLDRVDVEDVFNVRVALRRPHLRIAALLDLPLVKDEPGQPASIWSPYDSADSNEGAQQSFLANSQYRLAESTQAREILERTYDNPQSALQALRRGDIDLVDRVFPADVDNVRRDPTLQLRAYRLPSVHMLIANPSGKFVGNRVFRRALVYGLDRETILKRELLGGREQVGCRVISGPFPAGIDRDDPLGYAYDFRIEPRAYDPRHARTLVQLAQIEIQKEAQKNQETAPQLASLVLAFPASELARVACASMVEDLKLLGIQCTLQPLPPGSCWPSDNDWDLLYLDCVLEEPLVDAPHLLATDGLAACSSPHLNLALRQLQRATSWNQAGDRLRAVHQICFDDTSVIPLWQMVDHLAFARELTGLVERPITTYQGVESWTLQYVAPQ